MSEIDVDRLCAVLSPLKRASRTNDGRPPLQHLATTLGAHIKTLSRSGLHRCSKEWLSRVAEEAIALQNLDKRKTWAFLIGKSEQPADLSELIDARACTVCGLFKDDIDPRVCKCRECLREHRRKEKSKTWAAAVEAKIGEAPEPFRRAWEANRANPSYAAMAATLGWSVLTFSKKWVEEGLPARPVGRMRRTSSFVGPRRRPVRLSRSARSDQQCSLPLPPVAGEVAQ